MSQPIMRPRIGAVFDLRQKLNASAGLRDNRPMPTLQTLRQARMLARVVLAWFVLSVGLAIAAPIVQPQSLALVCSAAGAVKLLPSGDEGSKLPSGHLLDCVLCLAMAAPPPVAPAMAIAVQPLAYALQGIPAAHIAWRTASPLPARGPPQTA
jgi:hypothetical protein